MRTSRLKLEAIDLTPSAWYYEDKGGIEVFAEKRTDEGLFIARTMTFISWRKLKASLKRKEADDIR